MDYKRLRKQHPNSIHTYICSYTHTFIYDAAGLKKLTVDQLQDMLASHGLQTSPQAASELQARAARGGWSTYDEFLDDALRAMSKSSVADNRSSVADVSKQKVNTQDRASRSTRGGPTSMASHHANNDPLHSGTDHSDSEHGGDATWRGLIGGMMQVKDARQQHAYASHNQYTAAAAAARAAAGAGGTDGSGEEDVTRQHAYASHNQRTAAAAGGAGAGGRGGDSGEEDDGYASAKHHGPIVHKMSHHLGANHEHAEEERTRAGGTTPIASYGAHNHEARAHAYMSTPYSEAVKGSPWSEPTANTRRDAAAHQQQQQQPRSRVSVGTWLQQVRQIRDRTDTTPNGALALGSPASSGATPWLLMHAPASENSKTHTRIMSAFSSHSASAQKSAAVFPPSPPRQFHARASSPPIHPAHMLFTVTTSPPRAHAQHLGSSTSPPPPHHRYAQNSDRKNDHQPPPPDRKSDHYNNHGQITHTPTTTTNMHVHVDKLQPANASSSLSGKSKNGVNGKSQNAARKRSSGEQHVSESNNSRLVMDVSGKSELASAAPRRRSSGEHESESSDTRAFMGLRMSPKEGSSNVSRAHTDLKLSPKESFFGATCASGRSDMSSNGAAIPHAEERFDKDSLHHPSNRCVCVCVYSDVYVCVCVLM
jgi:hypothetical protein